MGLARTILAANGRFALVFHGIAGHRHPAIPLYVQPHLTMAELRLVLCWLRDHFAFLTPEEFLGSGKSGVLLTFDDGLANNYTHALSVLAEFSAPAILFISTQHVVCPRDWLPATRALAHRRWRKEEDVPEEVASEFFDGMSQEQLAACARHPLITIGSHTVSHPFLTRCNRTQLEFELISSRQFLQDLTGQAVELFAYPTGDYDQNVAEAVRSAGYQAAFAVDTRNLGLPAFEIPRISIYFANRAYLSLKLSGLHRRAIRGQLTELLPQPMM